MAKTARTAAERTAKPEAAQPKKIPRTVLDKITFAIRNQPPSSNGGVSRVSILKYIAAELNYDNENQVKAALKKGVTSGKLIAITSQSYAVAGDPDRKIPDVRPKLEIVDVAVGGEDDRRSSRGDAVTVQYVGKLDSGYVFDSSKSFQFVLGAGDVIKGWDQGLVGMAMGGKRKLIVPSHLGYGKRGCAPDIPPNATLHFEVTLHRID